MDLWYNSNTNTLLTKTVRARVFNPCLFTYQGENKGMNKTWMNRTWMDEDGDSQIVCSRSRLLSTSARLTSSHTPDGNCGNIIKRRQNPRNLCCSPLGRFGTAKCRLVRGRSSDTSHRPCQVGFYRCCVPKWVYSENPGLRNNNNVYVNNIKFSKFYYKWL